MADEDKSDKKVEEKYSGALFYVAGGKVRPIYYSTRQKGRFASDFMKDMSQIARAVWREDEQTESELIKMAGFE